MMPLPAARDEKSAPFFDAAAEGRLLVRRCGDCQQGLPPEAVVCTTCGGTDLTWIEAVGTGSLITWCTVHRAPNRGYSDFVPYVVGVVELDEGPWLYALLRVAEPRADLRVRAAFTPPDEGDAIPVFEQDH